MSVLKLRKIGDPVLRKIAQPLDPQQISQPAFQKLIDDMIETMKDAGGVGLAAPQIGISQRLFVLQVEAWIVEARKKSYYGLEREIPIQVWINPEVEILDPELVLNSEGCLSVDGYLGMVERHEKLRISGLNREGKQVTQEVWGYHARIVQHELDHLNGLLYIDRVPVVYRRESSGVLGSRYESLRASAVNKTGAK